MKYLRIKEVIIGLDDREENVLEKDNAGNPIKFLDFIETLKTKREYDTNQTTN